MFAIKLLSIGFHKRQVLMKNGISQLTFVWNEF